MRGIYRGREAEVTVPLPFIAEVKKLRKEHRIHGRVTSALVAAVTRMFPDWTCISEISQTPGGRNDAVLFESSGESICFELFATKAKSTATSCFFVIPQQSIKSPS